MKRSLLLFLSSILLSFGINAQSSEAFKYQAVARDATGEILSNQSLSFRISILQESASGTSVYSETHEVSTNIFGLVNLEISNGTIVSGDFSTIDWGADTYFVQVEMDEAGGSNYQTMGTSQLLSVPYALYAKNGSTKYQIGDQAKGGIIFWVDETGEHGLVAAPIDQSDGIAWSNGELRVTNATGDGIGAGEMNTMLIIALQTNDNTTGNFASKLCSDLMITGANGEIYGDWYLPSKHELDLMYNNLHSAGLGNFNPSKPYWTSKELDSTNAWIQSFANGGQIDFSKTDVNCHVRAVRAF
jgi:hypothetical protein